MRRYKQPSTWAGAGTIVSLLLFALPNDLSVLRADETTFLRGALFATAILCALLAILLNETPHQ